MYLKILAYFTLIYCLLLQACSKKTIELASLPLADYFPLVVGAQKTYQLDSTVITQFGADTTVHKYRISDLVDAELMDGANRKGYRIFRSITDSNGTKPYQPSETFMTLTHGSEWVEHVENNLRFMKLRFPIIEGFKWPGNSFIDASTVNSPNKYLADWTYTYKNVGMPFTLGSKTYPNTITVHQREETFPEGPFNKSQPFKQWDYSIEVYAAGIGLIYKNFDHKVWQGPPTFNPGKWEDGSYRVVMRIIE